MPPITDAQIILPVAAQQAAASILAPATNMLSSALNNAVESGRRMVDLQSHQEDLFMTEREKLRLASERKGLEARRMFESDRTFNEDVTRDRRNFAEDMFRDKRNFLLKERESAAGIAQGWSGLGIQGYNAETGRMQADTQGEYYRSRVETERTNSNVENRLKNLQIQQLESRAGVRPPLAAQLNYLSGSPVIGGVLDQRHQNILGVGTDFYRSDPSFLPIPTADTSDLYNQDVQQIKYIVDNYSREDLDKIYDQLTPEQRIIADELKLKKEITRQAMPRDSNPAKRNSFNLPGMGINAAATPGAIGQAQAAANALNTWRGSKASPGQVGQYVRTGTTSPTVNQGNGLLPEILLPGDKRPADIRPIPFPTYENQ